MFGDINNLATAIIVAVSMDANAKCSLSEGPSIARLPAERLRGIRESKLSSGFHQYVTSQIWQRWEFENATLASKYGNIGMFFLPRG
jgi:hypothetical protein